MWLLLLFKITTVAVTTITTTTIMILVRFWFNQLKQINWFEVNGCLNVGGVLYQDGRG